MKEKGFTLIELLAVIVILAIIALIAVPIILNIINDSKKSSDMRSIELYGKAVENAIGQYQVKKPEDSDITLTKVQKYIKYKGNTVVCETKINKDGTVYLDECKVDGKDVDYTYGKEKICTLVEGTAQQVGSKYTCELDEARTFYVLENNASSDEITLLMDRNYTDEEVLATMAWCDQSGTQATNSACNHDGLDPYIEKIQTKFGSSVIVGIPSREQIEDAYTGSMPQWLYDHISSLVLDIHGYWTSTVNSYVSNGVWFISSNGVVGHALVSNGSHIGLRPVITVSKSKLS